MLKLSLAGVLALAVALGSAAMAQQDTNGTTTTGIAKPPPGMVPPQPHKLDRNNPSSPGSNIPTLPQVALHPDATIGSGVPLAGPGGTSRNPTGD